MGKFDDIWNATTPPPPRKNYAPVGIGRVLGDISNALWYRPAAFVKAVLSKEVRS